MKQSRLNKHNQQVTIKLHRVVSSCNGCIKWLQIQLDLAYKQQVRVCSAELSYQ